MSFRSRNEKSEIIGNSARTRLFGDRFLSFFIFFFHFFLVSSVSDWYDNARISAVKKNHATRGSILWVRYCFVSIIYRRYRWLSCAVGCGGSSIPCGIYDNGPRNKRQRARKRVDWTSSLSLSRVSDCHQVLLLFRQRPHYIGSIAHWLSRLVLRDYLDCNLIAGWSHLSHTSILETEILLYSLPTSLHFYYYKTMYCYLWHRHTLHTLI